jgi:hypothetical protein
VLKSTANGQLQSQHEYKQQQYDNTGQKTKNKNKKIKKSKSAKAILTQTRLTKNIYRLQTALAAETHLAEGQWLKEQLNVVKLCMFRVGTRRPTVSRTEGQCLVSLKAFIKNSASM